MKLFSLLLSMFVASIAVNVEAQVITTISGSGTNQAGFAGDGGLAVYGRFNTPGGMVMNDQGDLFIADKQNNRIRKIDRYGYLSTIAGKGVAGRSGDGGPATAAKLNYPAGMTVDKNGNLFFADYYNRCVRKISTDGIITNVAGTGNAGRGGDSGLATLAQLNGPADVAFDDAGNLYISEELNDVIRKVDTTGRITTIAGNGTRGKTTDNVLATKSCLNSPRGMAFSNGNLLVASGNCVRKINLATGMISKLAGDDLSGGGGDGGPAKYARFNTVTGLAVDKYGNVFVSDYASHRVRMIDTSGNINTVAGKGLSGTAGDGGDADAAGVYRPDGVATDGKGNLYIADGDHNIRFVFMGDLKAATMRVFPNPCIEQCTILLESSFEELATLFILDEMGNTTKTIVAPTNREIQVTLNVKGVYMLYATSKHKKWQGKVMSLHNN